MSTLVALQVKVSTVNNLALAFDFALDGQRESEEVASCLTSIIATVRELDDLVLRLAGDGGGDIARRAIAAAVSTLEDTLNGGDYATRPKRAKTRVQNALTELNVEMRVLSRRAAEEAERRGSVDGPAAIPRNRLNSNGQDGSSSSMQVPPVPTRAAPRPPGAPNGSPPVAPRLPTGTLPLHAPRRAPPPIPSAGDAPWVPQLLAGVEANAGNTPNQDRRQMLQRAESGALNSSSGPDGAVMCAPMNFVHEGTLFLDDHIINQTDGDGTTEESSTPGLKRGPLLQQYPPKRPSLNERGQQAPIILGGSHADWRSAHSNTAPSNATPPAIRKPIAPVAVQHNVHLVRTAPSYASSRPQESFQPRIDTITIDQIAPKNQQTKNRPGNFFIHLRAYHIKAHNGNRSEVSVQKTEIECRKLMQELEAVAPGILQDVPVIVSDQVPVLTMQQMAGELQRVQAEMARLVDVLNNQEQFLASAALERFFVEELQGPDAKLPSADAASKDRGGFFTFGRSTPKKAHSMDLLPRSGYDTPSNDDRPKFFSTIRRKSQSKSRPTTAADAAGPASSTDPGEAPGVSFDEFSRAMIARGGYALVKSDRLSMYDNTGAEVAQFHNKNGYVHVAVGTASALFELLISDAFHEQNYKKCFLLTYRTFMKPADLLIRAIEAYKASRIREREAAASGAMLISHPDAQKPLVKFVEYWIERHWEDFDDEPQLVSFMDKFISIIERTERFSEQGQRIRKVFAEKSEGPRRLRIPSEPHIQVEATLLEAGGNGADFLTLPPEAIARQITRIDNDLFQRVKALDFLKTVWGAKLQSSAFTVAASNEGQGPTAVDQWPKRFNQLSFWVATEVCTTPELKARVQVVEKLIKVLKHLKELNNYNAVMAFIAGLNLSSVRRLKKTWASVGSRSIATLHEIENTMNPEHNYQTYREMENKRRGQPFIPFLGLYLKDLTFANDGNAKTLDDGRTGGAQLVNFDKAWGVFGIIERAYQLQRIPYLLEDEGAATAYCKRLITIGEKQLYERSLLCEPRPPAEGSSGGGGEEFGLRSTLSRMLKSK